MSKPDDGGQVAFDCTQVRPDRRQRLRRHRVLWFCEEPPHDLDEVRSLHQRVGARKILENTVPIIRRALDNFHIFSRWITPEGSQYRHNIEQLSIDFMYE